jgi:hypothetical protein
MADPKSHKATSPDTHSVVETAVKAAVEQALVVEAVGRPDYAMSFSRIFNRDGDSFSRIFSRGGTQLRDLTLQDLTSLDDAAFKKFTERLKVLQEAPTE